MRLRVHSLSPEFQRHAPDHGSPPHRKRRPAAGPLSGNALSLRPHPDRRSWVARRHGATGSRIRRTRSHRCRRSLRCSILTLRSLGMGRAQDGFSLSTHANPSPRASPPPFLNGKRSGKQNGQRNEVPAPPSPYFSAKKPPPDGSTFPRRKLVSYPTPGVSGTEPFPFRNPPPSL